MFNKLKNIENGKFKADLEKLQFGVSSLHARIRCFETLLHISYRLDFKKLQCRSTEEKLSIQNRKKKIQKLFEEKFKMRVDQPLPGGSGNSNNGNVARRAFANP